jgi:hypothetical protein
MFAFSSRTTCVPFAKTQVPSAGDAKKALSGRGANRTTAAKASNASDSEFIVAVPDVGIHRRTAMAAALGLAGGVLRRAAPAFAANGVFAIAETTTDAKTFEFKTYRLTAPSVYEEVNVPLKDPATGIVSPTVLLLKDTRVGQAGNTISVSKQNVPEGGIKTVSDIGTAKETADRLVSAEGARSTGKFGKAFGGNGSGVSFIDAYERKDEKGLLYYTAEYSKSVLGVARVVLTTLVVADGQLYTLTAEEDQGRFENEMADGLRQCVKSFEVIPQTPVAVPAAAQATKTAGKKGKGRK